MEVKLNLKLDSQTDKVLSHIERYDGITSMEAFEKYRITRLSAKIFELRKRGVKVITDMQDGKDGQYAVYRLQDGQTILRLYPRRRVG